MTDRRYYTDEAILPVPPGFVDRSTNILEWTSPEGAKLALLVHRHALEPADVLPSPVAAFDAYVHRETKDYPVRLAGFRLDREDDESPDAAMPVRRRGYRFRHEEKVIYQCQAFILLGPRILVLTAASEARLRDEVDRMVDEAIAGLKVWDE